MQQKALTWEQMHSLCQELQKQLIGATFKACLNLDRWHLIFIFQTVEGQEKWLLFCLSPLFLRFHFIRKQRCHEAHQNPLLNTTLAQATLTTINLINQDRILRLDFQQHKQRYSFIAEFFPKKPNYYLLDDQGTILFAFHPISQTHYTSPLKPKQILSKQAPLFTHAEVESLYEQLEKKWEFQQNKIQIEATLKQTLKRIQARQTKLEIALTACEAWSHWQHEGELLKTYFYQLKRGLNQIKVWDWEKEGEVLILLDPRLTPQEEVAIRFQRSKKLHQGISHLQEQIIKIQAEKNRFENQLKAVEQIVDLEELNKFKPPLKSISKPALVKKNTPQSYQQYQSATGIQIWVGKNAKANEEITFRLAKGSDWWLHVRDFPGSHVVIRTIKKQEPDVEAVADAMQLALYYSKAKQRGEAEVCLTQIKFVSRLKRGSTGQVQISKHKTIIVRADPKRYQAIKDRQKESVLERKGV